MKRPNQYILTDSTKASRSVCAMRMKSCSLCGTSQAQLIDTIIACISCISEVMGGRKYMPGCTIYTHPIPLYVIIKLKN